FRESAAPVEELCRASLIGLFWSLTPLVGIQMTIVAVNWSICRALGYRFTLPIAIAWTWVTNPITMPFFYYGFYVVGVFFFRLLGLHTEWVSFSAVSAVLSKAQEMSMIDGSLFWVRYMVAELGLPMLVGGFVVSTPAAIAGYPLTRRLVNMERQRRAAKLGISLSEWEAQYVRRIER